MPDLFISQLGTYRVMPQGLRYGVRRRQGTDGGIYKQFGCGFFR
jgi:hypothetical protein